jgi:hypothetical protein
MKIAALFVSIFAFLPFPAFRLQAQVTAFTYNGRLNDNGIPANGTYQMRFILYDVTTGGKAVGFPVTVSSVDVVNGLFTASPDFGPTVFTGAPLWLEVGVQRSDAAVLTTLTPRQALTAAPYAVYANTAGGIAGGAVTGPSIKDAAISAAKIADGQVVKSLNGLTDALKLEAGPNVMITPRGSSLVISATGGGGGGGGGGGVWNLNGLNAYFNAGNVGIGTDNPPEKLTIANVAAFNSGLKLTGNSPGGTGFALENTALGGHKYSVFSGSTGTSVGAGGFGIYDDTTSAYRFAISPSGKVGVGTPTPVAALDVQGDWDGSQGALNLSGNKPTLRFTGGGLGGSSWLIQVNSDSPGNLEFYNKRRIASVLTEPHAALPRAVGPIGTPVADFGLVMAVSPLGSVGIGTADPQENLTIAGVANFDSGLKLTGNTADGVGLALDNTITGGHKYALFSAGSHDGVENGGFGIYDETAKAYRLAIRANGEVGIGKSKPLSMLDVDGTVTATGLTINGDATVGALNITGGADLAEPFQMPSQNIPQGAVVIIDDEHPGQLKLSIEAYDTRVAGVVSGANGIHPGISLRQKGELDAGRNVALSGRVYVQTDAGYAPIRPGDLLTTSDTPGHAMKASNHEKAHGAILGKAMSGLKEGKGLVLVLVTLQ